MPVVVQQAPAQSLLAYLILHCDSRQPRQQLAYLFWPDSTEAQAFANLRRTLHQLRHALPDSERFLASDGRTIQWQPDAPFSCDVALFEEQLAAADQAAVAGKMEDQQAALEAAVDLYTGDLLPSCYDDWILPERERLRERFAESLARLIDLLEQSRAYKSAIRHANRLLHADPLREESYQQVMRLYALVGDRAAALHTYHTCVSTLRRELNVEPDAATQELYARMLNAANFLPTREPTAALTRRQALVGREVEWQYLLASWQAASQGTARVVVIAGEAGIGKTRLAEELYNFVGQQGFLAVRTRAYAVTGDLAYAPVTELLCSKALGELWRRLDMVWLTELSRLLPELLIERPQLHRPEPLSESWQRTRLFEALARAGVLVGQPLLLVLDDLQWCDRESLTWLPFLLRFAAHSPLLVVATLRSEEVSGEHALFPLLTELQREGQLAEITLAPLSAAETATMATQWLGFALSPEKAVSLYTESEGFPLFIVEMLNTRMERVEVGLASPMQGAAALPAKVQATIQSRLAQLSPLARQLADAAAVVGRALDLTVLATISELTAENFVQGLDELWRRRIIREQGGNAYDFSHDKIREVAYAAMSPVRRRWLHQRVAQAMEQVHSGDLDTVSGQIAEHYTEAALPQVALDYYERAAAVARRLYAHSDAATYLNKALALLPNLPVTEELLHRKLRIQLTLARSLESRHGMSAGLALCSYTCAVKNWLSR